MGMVLGGIAGSWSSSKEGTEAELEFNRQLSNHNPPSRAIKHQQIPCSPKILSTSNGKPWKRRIVVESRKLTAVKPVLSHFNLHTCLSKFMSWRHSKAASLAKSRPISSDSILSKP
jgi:hypothetical protein